MYQYFQKVAALQYIPRNFPKSRVHIQDRQNQGGTRGLCPPSPTFLRRKKKKEKQRKKQRVLKQKLLKDCQQSQNVTALAILERIEYKNFSSQPTVMADKTFECSMAPPL